MFDPSQALSGLSELPKQAVWGCFDKKPGFNLNKLLLVIITRLWDENLAWGFVTSCSEGGTEQLSLPRALLTTQAALFVCLCLTPKH